MNRFIKTGKDKIKKEELSNVVYQVNCRDCNYSYVGQTKRKLKTRLKEYMNDLKKPTDSCSVISCHRLDKDHEIDWENAKILDSECSYYKRLVAEMIHIKLKIVLCPTPNIFCFLSFLYPSLSFHNINRPCLLALVSVRSINLFIT